MLLLTYLSYKYCRKAYLKHKAKKDLLAQLNAPHEIVDQSTSIKNALQDHHQLSITRHSNTSSTSISSTNSSTTSDPTTWDITSLENDAEFMRFMAEQKQTYLRQHQHQHQRKGLNEEDPSSSMMMAMMPPPDYDEAMNQTTNIDAHMLDGSPVEMVNGSSSIRRVRRASRKSHRVGGRDSLVSELDGDRSTSSSPVSTTSSVRCVSELSAVERVMPVELPA